MAFTWSTAGEIINHAAVEVGLDAVADPYASTDPNFIRLRTLLDSVGRELVHRRIWSHLRKTHVFTTAAGRYVYPLPCDYHNMLDQTGWNRTNRLPIGGPLSPQEWSYLRARLVGVVYNVLFRPAYRVMELYPSTGNTPAGYEISYDYVSLHWVSLSVAPTAWQAQTVYAPGARVKANGYMYTVLTGGTSGNAGEGGGGSNGPSGTGSYITDGGTVVYQATCPYPDDWAQGTAYALDDIVVNGSEPYFYRCIVAGTSDGAGTGPSGSDSAILDGTCYWMAEYKAVAEAPTAASDLLWFDELLLIRALKWSWLSANGFDTTAALQDYEMTYERVTADDSPGVVLNLTKQLIALREPLIGNQSVPITGYGS